jgi:perosamine synthetase
MTHRRLGVWPPLPPAVHVRSALPRPLPFPLEDQRCRMFARARHALWHGVRALGLGPGDQVLVPAYHHGSEIEALARAGLTLRWYEGDGRLRPVEEELERLVGPRVRALYLIHYLGFPQDAMRWRRWCDDHHLLLIEDAAQAWLASHQGRPVGSLGDLAVFCLHKTVGVPEGAALVSRIPPPPPPTDARLGAWALGRRHGAWLAQRSAPMHALSAWLSPRRPYSPARDRELGDPAVGAGRSIVGLLARLSDPQIAAQRRAHYAVLLDALRDQVPPPFDDLPDGASPFTLPLVAGERPALVRRLERAGVRAVQLWSVPHPLLPLGQFPAAADRRWSTIGLPVHQELRPSDLDTIIAAAGVPHRPKRRELTLEPVSSLDELESEWTTLAARARNLFATWEFVTTWWRHFGTEGGLLLHAARDAAGRLIAILPVYRTSIGGLRAIRFLGHGIADELGPVCAEGDRAATGRALRRALRAAIRDWDLFVAERLPAAAGWEALVGGGVVRRESSPVLHLGDLTWDEFLRTRSANLRGQLRTRERKLLRDHDVRFRLAVDPERLDGDLDCMFALHSQRWGNGSSAFSPRRREFHREFAALALQRGWLRLWLAEIDRKPVAAWYGFRFAGADWFYQSGRDPSYDRLSVGFVLMGHTIRAALEDHQREYRLLRGPEPYKRRFSTDDAPVDTVVLPRGTAGRAALAAVRGAARSPAARHWMAGMVGGDPDARLAATRPTHAQLT